MDWTDINICLAFFVEPTYPELFGQFKIG